MEIIKSTENNVSVFALNGRLDTPGSQKAQETVIPGIPKSGKMIIDMSNCGYVASSGLRVLLIAAKQSAQLGCKTVLCGLQPLVNDVMEMTGFEDVLEAFPTRTDALTNLA